jgi:hypothetical protein
MEIAQIKIGQPDEWQAFQLRHPKFIQNLQPLYDTITKIFIREMKSFGPADKVVFYLGRLAVEDFNEILLLCGNGFGVGGMKILRGLYERVVTLLYISDNPSKSDDFLYYFKVHQGRFLNHAKEVFPLDKLKLSAEEVTEILENYEKAKGRYQVNVCKKCGTTRTMNSWSELDTLSMARKAGIEKLYVPCFFHPTLQVHTTVASLCSRVKLKGDDGLTFIDGPQHNEADFSLNGAHSLILCALIGVNDYFKMGLKEEIEERFGDFKLIWGVKED